MVQWHVKDKCKKINQCVIVQEKVIILNTINLKNGQIITEYHAIQTVNKNKIIKKLSNN
jgi:hypothetical protein